MEVNVPHTAEFTAEVNAPQLVTLYAQDGETIQVAPDKVNTWLGRGFSLKETDLDAIMSELKASIKALQVPWADYLKETRQNGYIPNGAQEAAHAALNMVTDAANRLHIGIHNAFNPQGESAE